MTLEDAELISPAPISDKSDLEQKIIVDKILSWSQSVTRAFEKTTGIDLDNAKILEDAWDTRFLWLATYVFIQTKMYEFNEAGEGSIRLDTFLLTTYSGLVNNTLSILESFDLFEHFYEASKFVPNFHIRLYDYLAEGLAVRAKSYQDSDKDNLFFASWYALKAKDLYSGNSMPAMYPELDKRIASTLGEQAHTTWTDLPCSSFEYYSLSPHKKLEIAQLIHDPLIDFLIALDTTELDVEWIAQNLEATKKLSTEQKLMFANEAGIVEWSRDVLSSQEDAICSYLGALNSEYLQASDDSASDELKIAISGYCLANLPIQRYEYLVYDLIEVLCRTSQVLFDSYKLHCLDYFYTYYPNKLPDELSEFFEKLVKKPL